MASDRARAGGEVGKNGEFYPGGTFLPTTEMHKRGSRPSPKATGRREIEPGVWAAPPVAGMKSLFRVLNLTAILRDGRFAAIEDYATALGAEEARVYYAQIDAYNAGTRWF